MTKVELRREAKGAEIVFGLRMQGHAEYAAAGPDIVCAAESMLCTTLAEMMARHAGEKWSGRMEPGRVELEAIVPAGQETAWNWVFDTISAGFELLESKYPGCVKLVENNYVPKSDENGVSYCYDKDGEQT